MKILSFFAASPALSAVMTGAKLQRLMDDRLAREGLNLRQSLILIAIFFEPDQEARPKDLAEVFQTTKGNISHALSFLEEQKLVQRINLPKDARGFLIRLTPKAHKVCQRLIGDFDRLQRQTEALFGIEETKNWMGGMRQIYEIHRDFKP